MSKRIELSVVDKVTVATIKDPKLVNDLIINETVSELTDLVSSEEHPLVVIDFEGVEFLSTEFLGGLAARVNKAAATHRTQVKLCSISDRIMEAFQIVAFDRIFDIRENRRKALKAFGANGA